MKRLSLILGAMLLINSIFAQNFIGMSQSKITAKFGQPDRKVDSVFIYNDPYENGTNTYFFNSKGICYEFRVMRDADYLKSYLRMLRKDFIASGNDKKQFIAKKGDFQAVLTSSETEFQITITQARDVNSSGHVCFVGDL